MKSRKRLRVGVLLAIVGIVAMAVLWLATRGSKPPLPLLRVPEGFEVELAAGPPLVERPITADFDERGRLYVAESSGSNDPVEIQLEQKPHRIVRLEDTDGDGLFDRRSVFADNMMLPQGTLWLDGSLYVSAPPVIWKLTDTNGDGVADLREEWFDGKTLTHCANDLHGPYLGLDGWIYWCKGAFGEQTYERPNGAPFVTRAAHIFRRHPDSSFVEPVLTGGMDNPVDVDFTPEGERILTATFFEHPQLGRRDALIHAIYGGIYGKVHGVLDGHQRTGHLMPNLTHYGPAAPAGLTRYASRAFGDDYRDNFFACLFNLHKVTRHALEPSGATFKTRDSDFLVSSDPDFHPTDVLEDADGSLLVIDTGGWYKLCCPTSQLHKPDVLGGIYRIRRKGAPAVADPRGLEVPWSSLGADELTKFLDDARPAVQRRGIRRLAKLNKNAVPALSEVLEKSDSLDARRNAVWALTQVEDPQAREAVHLALTDPAAGVRQAAAHSVSVRRDATALPQLRRLLKDESPHVQRVAAEALGRIANPAAISDLLAAAAEPADRILEHSLTYALIETADPEETARGLKASASNTRRAALVALDQMNGGGLRPETVIPYLTAGDPLLEETAWWIAGLHPEWGGALARFFSARLAEGQFGPEERTLLEERLVQFAGHPEIQDLLARKASGAGPEASRFMALRAMAGSQLKEMPPAWTDVIERLIRTKNADLVSIAVAVARALPVPAEAATGLGGALLAASLDRTLSPQLRLNALAAVSGGLSEVDAETFEFLRSSLEPAQPVGIRTTAAGVFETAKLTPEQLLILTDSLEQAGPLELSRLLPAFDHGDGEELGFRMIAALRQSKALSSVRPDLLLPRLSQYPESVRVQGERLLASLDRDPAKQREHISRLFATLGEGDVRRGQAVFNGEKAACSTCHAIGYLGGRLGPDLTRIGEIRSERDLLEAIVYPDASFVRSYEPFIVLTVSGDTHSGILRKDAPGEVILATGADQEVRIPRSEIAEMQPGTVSVMPSGLDQQLTQQELADLLAFLKAARR